MIRLKLNSTKRKEVIDITGELEHVAKQNNWEDGTLLLYLPHCTAAIIINEFEPAINEDYLRFFERITEGKWKHDSIDDNAYAHLLNSAIGGEKFIFVRNGELQLGTWQSVLLIELDGPRERSLLLKFIPDK